MLTYIREAANKTYTENGAVTYKTTGSDCLDLFASVGALRREPDKAITDRFLRAYSEDPDLTMKLLFFARDIRGGLGERRVFRTALRWMAAAAPMSVKKNLPFIPEFGRWDDLLCLIGTPCEPAALENIRQQLQSDLLALERDGKVSLLAKWLPSVNASNARTVHDAKHIAHALGMSDADYRKTLVKLRARIRIIENNLRERDYTFDYEKQPSRALFKYRKAFRHNDRERYRLFLEQVAAGRADMHTGGLMPYEIISPFFERNVSDDERRAINVTWNAQADFTGAENALAVVDGSGSMYWDAAPMPITAALSLGIYFAQRNRGAFRNHFVTFSETPQLVEIKGRDIMEKVLYCAHFSEAANTNLQKVFELLLDAAVQNHVPQQEMPSALYIISDMEFDECTDDSDLTHFARAAELFAQNGYQLPRVVFWNVASRHEQQPVTQNEQGAVLVSGCTPRLFDMLRSGTLSPRAYMMEILGSARYRGIAA